MTLRLTIQHTRLQRDSLDPPDGDEAEIIFWKRVKLGVLARDGTRAEEFEAQLDVRSRLLQVQPKGERGPDGMVTRTTPKTSTDVVATVLINEMTTFTLRPRDALFVRKSGNATFSEWIVVDAEHASGLLHRLKEAKEFDARLKPPHPPGYESTLAALLDAVHENLLAMQAFKVARDQPGPHSWDLAFNTFTWATLGSRFLELSGDAGLQLRFARFFDATRQFEKAVQDLRENPAGVPDYSRPPNLGLRNAVLNFLNQLAEPTRDLGHKLLIEHGRNLEIPVHLRGR